MNFTEHVKIREEKFGSVVFETLQEKVYVTNETGKDILELIKKGLATEDIVDTLADDYGLDPQDLKQDIFSFISQLKEKGILVR